MLMHSYIFPISSLAKATFFVVCGLLTFLLCTHSLVSPHFAWFPFFVGSTIWITNCSAGFKENVFSTHTYIHAYIHTYIHPCIHACMHACMHACIYIMYIYRIYIHVFNCIYITYLSCFPICEIIWCFFRILLGFLHLCFLNAGFASAGKPLKLLFVGDSIAASRRCRSTEG